MERLEISSRKLEITKGTYKFLGGLDSKVSVYNAGDPGSSPGLGRSPGEGNGNPLQYYCLENPMDRGAWQAAVYGVTKSWTRLSDFTSLQAADIGFNLKFVFSFLKGSRIDCDAEQSPVGFLGMEAFLSSISCRQNSSFHDLFRVPKGSTFGNQGRSSKKPPGARLKGPERLINMGRATNLLSNFTLLKLCRRRKNDCHRP